MHKSIYKILPSLMIISLLVYFTFESYSKSMGISGRTSSGVGCQASGCHNYASNSATSLSITDGNLSVNPGSTNNFTIRVNNQNTTQEKAGINLAVKTSSTGSTNAGSLSPASGSGLQSMDGELTHSSPKSFTDGNADFSFTWTAPTTPGKYYLRAVGNAVDGNGGTSGDHWNYMAVTELTVKGVTLTAPTGNNLSYCVGNVVAITWDQHGLSNVKIELSTNNGGTWTQTIEPSVSAASGLYNWTIPNDFQTGSQFKIRVTDASNSDINSSMANPFTIAGNFSIIGQPESKSVCAGANHSLKVSVSGSGVKFQWKKNGSDVQGATDSILTLTNIDQSKAGNYSVVLSSNCQTNVTSSEAQISVNPITAITAQPTTVNTCAGNNATFNITAQGMNLTYQWYYGISKIDGATQNEYSIPITKISDAGSYFCMAIGDCGTIKSTVVNLNVDEPADITKQPSNVSACEGKSATFSVDSKGFNNTYEWFLNEQKLEVPSKKELVIDNAAQSNVGSYHCIISNPCGESVRSNSVTLTLNSKPVITTNPQNILLTEGEKAVFSVQSSSITDTYQWRKNNVNIENAKSKTFEIKNVSKSDEADYDCIVTNSCGSTTSSKGKLTIQEKIEGPSIRFASQNVDLPFIYLGKSIESTIKDFAINNGKSNLKIDSIKVEGTDKQDFQISLSKLEILSGETADLSIKFSTNKTGLKSATVKVYSNSPESVNSFALSVDVVELSVTTSSDVIDYGNLEIGKSKIDIIKFTNTGKQPLVINSISFDCNENSGLKLGSVTLPLTLNPNEEIELSLEYTPLEVNSLNCSLLIAFADTDSTKIIPIKGNAVITSVSDDDLSDGMVAYPNPVDNNVIIQFELNSGIAYQIKIIDLSGIVLREYDGVATNNSNLINWDLKNQIGQSVKSGLYFAVLNSANNKQILKISVTK